LVKELNMSNTIKIAIVGALLLGLVILGYLYSTNKKEDNPSGPLSSQTGFSTSVQPQNTVVSQENEVRDQFLNLLLSMRNVKLDNSLFTSDSFKILRDFSSPLSSDGTQGRPNPFAPIGQDGPISGQSYLVTTSQVTQLTDQSANLSGLLPSGVIASERWFEWGTRPNLPFQNQTIKVSQNVTTGVFQYNLLGLTPDTTYYFRAAAKVGQVIIFGSVNTFKTNKTPEPPRSN
jgi:hypothetical protein